MKSKKLVIQFLTLLFVLLGIGFLIQNRWAETEQDLSLKFTYAFNLLFTLPIMLFIIMLIKYLKRYVGFIFLGLGIIKIFAFIIYTKNNEIDINRDNFLLFFIPYLICLFVEVFVLSRYLNKAKF